MLLSFITSYIDDHDRRVTDLSKIRVYYFNNGFALDFIALFPFYPLVSFHGSRYLFLIKCLRLFEAFEILDVNNFNRELKKIYKRDHDKIC